MQLYNLAKDPVETNKVQAAHPDIVTRLTGLLEKYIAEGRITPGPKQPNDVPINIRKANSSTE